jgi:dihydroxyacid dehydratase/phosphogluconate dehydratase
MGIFNSLVICFDYSTGPGTVNTGASVMIRLGLHLTPSGVVDRVAGTAKKIFESSGRSASKFTPMVVKLVGQ